jgi:putative ABC transport system substrate-binding protein
MMCKLIKINLVGTSNKQDTVIASGAKQSINRLNSNTYGSPQPLRGFAMTVFRGLLMAFMACLYFMQTAHAAETTTIAVTQIISHPALDKIREGVLDALKENGFSAHEGSKIIVDNASGNMGIAAQIAQKYVSMNPAPNVIVAITTPSAQTINKAIQGTQIPLIFAAVTDPVGAGLVPSLEQSSDHVTGTIDLPPMEKQLRLIELLLPKAKKIGILYSLGEPNAVYQKEHFRKLAEKTPYKITERGVSKATDIYEAAKSLAKKVDLILLFNDNTMIASLESILKAADGHHIPVFASDPDSVARGALAAVANDQYEVGRQTGVMISKLLQGIPISSLPPEVVNRSKVYVNDKVAHRHNIDPKLLKQARDMN